IFCFLGCARRENRPLAPALSPSEGERGNLQESVCEMWPSRPGLLIMIAICFLLLVGYWALMTFVPVPGIGWPSLDGPGKNLAHYLDDRYLPGKKFEGTLLSTMAAVANCLLGVFAGLLLQHRKPSRQKQVCW